MIAFFYRALDITLPATISKVSLILVEHGAPLIGDAT